MREKLLCGKKNFDTYDDTPMIPVIHESILMNSNIGFIQVGVCAQSPTLESLVIHFFAAKLENSATET